MLMLEQFGAREITGLIQSFSVLVACLLLYKLGAKEKQTPDQLSQPLLGNQAFYACIGILVIDKSLTIATMDYGWPIHHNLSKVVGILLCFGYGRWFHLDYKSMGFQRGVFEYSAFGYLHGLVLAGMGIFFLNWTANLFLIKVIEVKFLSAFYQELVFRGLLLGGLASRWGIRRGLIVSTIIFGLWHFDYSGQMVDYGKIENWTMVIYQTAIGFYFGLLYWRSKSLYPVIFLHFAWNFVVHLRGAP